MYSYNCAMQLYVPKRARKSVVSPCHVLRTHNREAAVQLHCTLLILSSTDHKRQSLNRLGHATCNASTPAASRLLCQLVCRAAIITTKLIKCISNSASKQYLAQLLKTLCHLSHTATHGGTCWTLWAFCRTDYKGQFPPPTLTQY